MLNPTQVGVSPSGVHGDGFREIGVFKVNASKDRIRHFCCSEVGAGCVALIERCPSEVPSLEVGTFQIAGREVGAKQVRLLKNGATKDRIRKNGADKARPFQIGTAEVTW